MKQKIYDAVLEVLSRHTFFHSGLAELQTKFPNILDTVSVKTLRSIQAQYYVRRMKRSTGRHYNRRTREKYYQIFKYAKARGEEHVIVRLALRNDISPCLLARIILEEYYWNDVKHDRIRDKPDGGKGSLPPGLITDLLRDIARVPNPYLARELYECMVLDNFYGPIIDSIKKHLVVVAVVAGFPITETLALNYRGAKDVVSRFNQCCGCEYEVILTSYCVNAGLTFIDEEQMRKEGYDKTPDIKLKIPIMINNKVVNWIESKASFGDPTNHQQYMVDQFLPYQNRFGDGAVIYWFGFVDELTDSGDSGIQLWDQFPSNTDILRLEDAIKKDKENKGNCSFNSMSSSPRVDDCVKVDKDKEDPYYNYVDPMFDMDESLCQQFVNKLNSHSEDSCQSDTSHPCLSNPS